MIAYTGLTRDRELRRELDALGVRPLVVRGELNGVTPGMRFGYDNGAFRDWQAGEQFDFVRFERDCWRMRDRAMKPDFVVAPDVVGDGTETLKRSSEWLPYCCDAGPVYLAVQNGMEHADVEKTLSLGFAGLLVGGTPEWKEATAAGWCALAHRLGLRAHIGRVGSAAKVRWAHECGADSIDSCVPLWSAENLHAWLVGLREVGATVTGAQMALPGCGL